MTSARRKEREYFHNSREYKHLASRMGSDYLAKMLSKVNIYFEKSFFLEMNVVLC